MKQLYNQCWKRKRAQNELTMARRRQWRVVEDERKHESKNIRENEAPENPSPMQENKQINETNKIYKPLVKKKESWSKQTYNGTRTQWSPQKKIRTLEQKQRENGKPQEERNYESVSGALQSYGKKWFKKATTFNSRTLTSSALI